MQGLWIPREYLINPNLTGNERLIISCIHYKADTKHIYNGTYRELALLLGIRENKISEAIASLVQKGFLQKLNSKKLLISEQWKYPKKGDIPQKGIVDNILKEERKNPKKENKNVPFQDSIPYRKTSKIENVAKDDFERKDKQINNKKDVYKKNQKEISFAESELHEFEYFLEYMEKEFPEADPNYYYTAIDKWSKTPQIETGMIPMRKYWKKVVSVFVLGDYKKGLMVLKNHLGYEKANQKNNSTRETGVDGHSRTELDSLVNQYLKNQQGL